MADFERFELANGDRRVGRGKDGARRSSAWKGYSRFQVAAALTLTTGSLLVSCVCIWSQKNMATQNSILKEEVDFLEAKIQTVEEKLLEIPGNFETNSQVVAHSRRMKRSNGGDSSRDNRRRRVHPKAAHLQLDAPPETSTTNELKWKLSTGLDTTPDRNALQFSFESNLLSIDKTSITIPEGGLYFIYAQIHFENAKPRNAFAVKVGEAFVMKCFQSLDYFNNSLTSTENSRLKPCYTASTIVLRRNHVVKVINLYPSHRIYNDPSANFWGIVKLADSAA